MKLFDIDRMFKEHEILMKFTEERFMNLYNVFVEAKQNDYCLKIIENMFLRGVDYVLEGREDNYVENLLRMLAREIGGENNSKSKIEGQKVTAVCSRENITTA
jgi:hypothetical protein